MSKVESRCGGGGEGVSHPAVWIREVLGVGPRQFGKSVLRCRSACTEGLDYYDSSDWSAPELSLSAAAPRARDVRRSETLVLEPAPSCSLGCWLAHASFE